MHVSVVLLTYNHERFVAQAIESVLAQEGVDFELVVTEDCSTDGTRAVAERYAARHPGRVRLLAAERNVGMTRALARGLGAARAPYVAFLDGDDFWTAPDKLRRQAAYLDAHPGCALCFHDVVLVGEDGRPAGPRAATPNEPAAPNAAAPNAAAPDAAGGGPGVGDEPSTSYTLGGMLERNPVPGCSALMRRTALAGLPGWFFEAEYGDWPLYLHVARSGTLDRIPAALGAYRLHGAGYWTGQRRRRQLEGRLRFNALLRRHLDPEYGPALRAVGAALSARLVRTCAAEGDVTAALGHALATARAVAAAPRRMLGGGRWRALAAALRNRPVAAPRGPAA